MVNLTLIKNIIYPLCLVGIWVVGFLAGSSYKESVWVEKELNKQNQHLTTAVKQAEQSQTVVTKYVEKIKHINGETKTIIKKVPIYVSKESDNACVIPDGFRLHWNQANQGLLSDGESSIYSNETPSAVKLSDIATQHAVEADLCKQTEAQLIALQDWVRTASQEQKLP